MTSLADSLPDDIATLRAFAIRVVAERDVAMTERDAAHAAREAEQSQKLTALAERDRLLAQNDRLRHLLKQLQRMQFGRKSEKLDPDQFNLALEDIECGFRRSRPAVPT